MDAAALIKKHGARCSEASASPCGWPRSICWRRPLRIRRSSTAGCRGSLLINISGLLTLLVLLAAKLYQLVKDFRRHVPGSRLKGRTVAIFSALAVAPILVVYYFALQFLNRGIDSWFELEVSQGLKDTRELSHAALEVRVREFLQHTELVAHELSGLPDFSLDQHPGPRAPRQRGARIHRGGRADADHRDELRTADGHAARSRDRRDDAAGAARPTPTSAWIRTRWAAT